MSLRFLLDTNVVSEPLKPAPNPGVLRRLAAHPLECAIAAVVWHELVFGCRRLKPSRRRRAIEAYLDQVVRSCFPILAYDLPAAEWHAIERARLVATGTPPPQADGQIAAIARVNDLVLVTANVADFRRFHGLVVETWIAV